MDNYATHQTALIRNWLAKRPRFQVLLDADAGFTLVLLDADAGFTLASVSYGTLPYAGNQD